MVLYKVSFRWSVPTIGSVAALIQALITATSSATTKFFARGFLVVEALERDNEALAAGGVV